MLRGAAVLFSMLTVAVVGCAQDDDGDGRLRVAAAFFPIEEVVSNVGDDLVRLSTLVPRDSEAHEYEPTPKQLTGLESADVVFYLAGFQPNLESAILGLPGSVEKVDLLQGITLRPDDPHVWLDPENMRTMAATVAATLAELDPANAAGYDANLATFAAQLTALDSAFTAGLEDCDARVVVTGHEAFGYLTDAYGLEQVPISGISPGEEPSAQTLEDVAAVAREHGVTTIFFEANLPDDLSRTVADEIGVGTAALNTMESLSEEQARNGDDYISAMDQNLAILRGGLGCH